MFELLTIVGLSLSPLEASEGVNKFCADVVGIPYASGNFTDEEWNRFVYCRESIRIPESQYQLVSPVNNNCSEQLEKSNTCTLEYKFDGYTGIIKAPPRLTVESHTIRVTHRSPGGYINTNQSDYDVRLYAEGIQATIKVHYTFNK